MGYDAPHNEQATTLITLTNGQYTLCNHHAREAIETMVEQGKQFNVKQHL